MKQTTHEIISVAAAGDETLDPAVAALMIEIGGKNPKPATLALIRDVLDGKLVPMADGKPEKILTVTETAGRLGRSRDGAQELLARLGVVGIRTGAQGKRIRGYREADVDRVVAELYEQGKEVK